MKRLFIIPIIALTLLTVGLFAGDFQKELKAGANPTLGPGAFTVTAKEIHTGHTTFILTGKIMPVSVGDETVGWIFSGEGKISLKVQKGPFYQGNVTTLDETYLMKLDKKDHYTDTFKKALFLTNRIPEDLFPEGKSGEAGSILNEVGNKIFERWDDSVFPGMDFTLTGLQDEAYPGDVFVASYEGGAKESLYQGDTFDQRQEFLGFWKKSPRAGIWYVRQAILQPLNFSLKKHPKVSYMQTGVDITVVSKDNKMVEETTKTEITSHINGVTLIDLNFTNGKSKTWKKWNKQDYPVTVTSVTDEAGKALPYAHKYDELMIKLPKPLARGEKVTLIIKAEGDMLKNLKGDSYMVLGNFAYFPQLSTTSIHGPFHSITKVKAPWVALATGKNVRRWKEGDLNCLETLEERPVDFPFIIVGRFDVIEKKKKDYDVMVYSYVMAKQKAGKKIAKNALSVMDFYSNGMVPFVYHDLEIAEIPYYRQFFWQSPAGIIEISSEAFNPIGGSESDMDSIYRRYASLGQNARLAHEMGHQWFGNLVAFQTDYDNWLSESFAEYLSYMFMTEGAKDKRKAKEQFAVWESWIKVCGDKASVYGAASASKYYTCLLYGKGPYVLHALRKKIGDENFKKVLHFMTLASEKKPRLKAITEDLILFVNAITKQDYHDWFNKYIYGTEIPKM